MVSFWGLVFLSSGLVELSSILVICCGLKNLVLDVLVGYLNNCTIFGTLLKLKFHSLKS